MKKKEEKSGFSAGFAVRLWVEVNDMDVKTLEEALALAKKMGVENLVRVRPGISIIDHFVDVVQVHNGKVLDKVFP